MSRFLAEGETRLSANLRSIALCLRNICLLQSVNLNSCLNVQITLAYTIQSSLLLFEMLALRSFG